MDTAQHPRREERFTIRTADLDASGAASPVALCGLLQELAVNHADELGLGMKSLIEGSGHTWMLSRMRIVFAAPARPSFGEEIRILTWPAGAGRVATVRCFRVQDSRGAEILRADTEWFYVHIARQRIARLPDEVMELLPRLAPRIELPETSEKFEFPEATRDEGGPPPAPRPSPPFPDTAEIRVRRADLDINNHVNHTHILAWLFEPLDLQMESGHLPPTVDHTSQDTASQLSTSKPRPPLRTMDVVFRQEARLGDTLVSAASRDGSRTFHKILRGDTVIAQAVLTWENRA